MTTLHGPARRLTIYLGESDTWQHKPTYAEIVHRAHAAGMAGASVLRGIEGFGTSQRIHTARLLSLSEDLPVVVVIVDTAEKVDAFLPVIDELVTEGLVTLDDVSVRVHRFRGSSGAASSGSDEPSGTPGPSGADR